MPHHYFERGIPAPGLHPAHQLAKGNLPLTGLPPPPVSPLSVKEVDCRERLGGLLKHYYRRVA